MKAEDSRQVDTDEEMLARNAGMALPGAETDVTTRLRTKAEWERASGLMDAVCERGNLKLAYQRVVENKGAAGVDGIGVAEFKDHLKRHWPTIKAKLLAGEYIPQPVRRVDIPKPQGGVRTLGIPTLTDRLIQQALHQALSPIFEAGFSESSYGFRPGRNAHQAVKAAKRYVAEGRRFVVDMDLEKFFDRVNHDLLMEKLSKKIGDGRVLRLIRRSLEAGMMAEGIVSPRTQGTPQGGPLSPLLSNILLTELDRELERRGHAFCRYADDCAPRRRAGGRESSVQPCCTRDEGRPLEVAVQAEASNHLLLLRSRGVVVSETGNGWVRPGQVWVVKSNASEPLMTCRKRRDDVETAGESLLRDKSGGSLCMARTASGMEAARARSRLLCGTWEPVTPMPREKRKGQPPERESTDAEYRDGATRSSVEGAVMAAERRGCPIRLETREQLATGGLS
jgi:Reverse transcriptase (RNA-dependent DNA polymerase)